MSAPRKPRAPRAVGSTLGCHGGNRPSPTAECGASSPSRASDCTAGSRAGASVSHPSPASGMGHREARPRCLLERAVNRALGQTGEATLFLNGAVEPDDEQRAELAEHGVRIERELVREVRGEAPSIELVLRDGRTERLAGLFVQPHTRLATPFAEQLGVALEEGPMGSFYAVDGMKATRVPGVFACGDAATAMASVSLAVAAGAIAGFAAHRSLVFRHPPTMPALGAAGAGVTAGAAR